MPEESQDHSVQSLVDLLQEGGPAARERLIARASDRLVRLTHKMLGGFPGVHRWEQTDDVLQNALLRLMRCLEGVAPATARDFFRLAATQIRRELIDLARKHYGPHGIGSNHASRVGSGDGAYPAFDPPDESLDPSRLAEWTAFHECVEQCLEDEQREVFDLIFYQGLSQAEAAEILGVADRTIKRRWQAARLALHEALGGRMPGA